MLALLNSLPKPTSLECFLTALERPLTLLLYASDTSLQPSPTPRSPRTFILREALELSVVFEGLASKDLFVGFRTSPQRSIKARLSFPVTSELSESTLFDNVRMSDEDSSCGACHVGEAHVSYPGFPAGVFESDVYVPFSIFEVSVESLRLEIAGCNERAEPDRCALLSALFDHGEVRQGTLADLGATK